jgi:hypothetical protein
VPLAPPSWSRLGPDLGSIRRWVRHSDRAALTLLADLGQCHSPWGQLTLADLDLPFNFIIKVLPIGSPGPVWGFAVRLESTR